MKIGFIGLGNMASAMIGGMLKAGEVKPENLLGSDKSEQMRKTAQEKFGMTVYEENGAVAEQADILFLAVKPIFFPDVMEDIRKKIKTTTVIVSIAAGKTVQNIEDGLQNKDAKIIRLMPNTPALVGEGCTAICNNENVTKEELETVKKLLLTFGVAEEIPERLFDAFIGISGSSPAYVFLFIEAMADAAVNAGMPRNQAYTFASQAVLGSAKMVLETGKHPGELKDMVCSPGGTTIAAVKVLEEKGMRAAVIDAVDACVEKSRNL
ncbi:MAG: pyrroline-5-carboxylate reductase [Lachnospiraceae bacterium]|nr:pyrroline-5-carboxylate reductase [Lachnospiraceae bacterium]